MNWPTPDANGTPHNDDRVRRPLRRIRDDPFDTVLYLVDTIGLRRATSLQEASTAAYLNGRLRRAGLDVSAEAFAVRLRPGWDGIGIAAGALAGVVLSIWSLALATVLLLAVGTWAALRWLRATPLIASARESQNIVGVQVGDAAARWRVVLLAPLDSPPLANRLVWLAQQPWAQAGRVILGVVLVATMLWQLRGGSALWIVEAGAIMLLGLLACAEAATQRTPASVGATSHAGAVAVLLSAVEEIAATEHVELWAVGIGAATLAHAGVTDLLRRYPFEQTTTVFVSLEGLGSGTLCYLTREGWLRDESAEPLLLELAAAADAADPVIDAEPHALHGHTTIGHALHQAGRRVLSITCLDESGHVPHAARHTDTPAVIDAAVLERAVRLVAGIVRQLDVRASVEA